MDKRRENCTQGVCLLAAGASGSRDDPIISGREHTSEDLRGLFPPSWTCSRTLKMSWGGGKPKKIPVMALYSSSPHLKSHCPHSPRPHTMDALFGQCSQPSSVRAAGPMMHDICITLTGSQPTVKMVNEGGEGADLWTKL